MTSLTDTHYFRCSVEIVTQAFEGKNQVARHRMIYSLLTEEFTGGLHALALKTKTPAEVEQ